jgi:hypothetical protein
MLAAVPGFRFIETQAGSYAPTDRPGEQRRMVFSVEARADSALTHLRTGEARLRGTLEMEGFAEEVPVEGSLTVVPAERAIRYELRFTGDDGQPYRWVGRKDIKLDDLRGSLTTIAAVLYDVRGRAVASATTQFDLRADLLQFLASWRPT